MAAAILVSLQTSGGLADVVYFHSPPRAAAESRIEGEVLDYTGHELRLRLPDGRERLLPGEHVARIETKRATEQLSGDRLLGEGRFEAAISALDKAAGQDRRPWVRREIRASKVRCLAALGRWREAGESFLQLLREDADTPYFKWIPLAWVPSTPSRAFRPAAEVWLRQTDHPAARLIAASHLLSTGRRGAALAALSELSNRDDRRIVALAKAQRWRTMAPSVTAAQIETWEALVERMPGDLQGGPYFVVGHAWAQHDKPRRAALALMHVPIFHPRQSRLAARCLLDSGEALERLGQTEAAARLYDEIVSRYGYTTAGKEAQSRIDAATTRKRRSRG